MTAAQILTVLHFCGINPAGYSNSSRPKHSNVKVEHSPLNLKTIVNQSTLQTWRWFEILKL